MNESPTPSISMLTCRSSAARLRIIDRLFRTAPTKHSRIPKLVNIEIGGEGEVGRAFLKNGRLFYTTWTSINYKSKYNADAGYPIRRLTETTDDIIFNMTRRHTTRNDTTRNDDNGRWMTDDDDDDDNDIDSGQIQRQR